jgi:hypothetical protein
MFKKIVLGILFAGFIGLLVWGGINRSLDQAAKTAEAAGNAGIGNGGAGNERTVSNTGTGSGRWQEQQDVPTGGAANASGGLIRPAAGQAQVETWVAFDAVVADADHLALTVALADGQVYLIEGRPWRFALEQGFRAEVGDMLRLTGFYEDTAFEVGQIDNLTLGQVTAVRGETGRPLWAGGGRAR